MNTTEPLTYHRSGHAALGRGRVSMPGQIYLVTMVTAKRQPHFSDYAIACRIAHAISRRELFRDGRLLAWVLMPDHWHGLVELGPLDSLSGVVARLKSVTARTTRPLIVKPDRLWARSYQDRALRNDESLLSTARYLVGNPRRAGLVERVGDYPFWDAIWLQDGTAESAASSL